MDDTTPPAPVTEAQVLAWLHSALASLKGVPKPTLHLYVETDGKARFLVDSDEQPILMGGDTLEEAYQRALAKVVTPQTRTAALRAEAQAILDRAAALDGAPVPATPSV